MSSPGLQQTNLSFAPMDTVIKPAVPLTPKSTQKESTVITPDHRHGVAYMPVPDCPMINEEDKDTKMGTTKQKDKKQDKQQKKKPPTTNNNSKPTTQLSLLQLQWQPHQKQASPKTN